VPSYELALPPGTKNIKIKTSTQEIPVDWSFTRDGKDGAEVIVPLMSGDEFVGEVLEGNWLKGDDGSIQGPFTAKINNGYLEMTGRSNSAGTYRSGWLSSQNKIPLLDDLIIDIHLKLPSHSSSDAFEFQFLLSDTGQGSNPVSSNYLRVMIHTDTSSYKIYADKTINGVTTRLIDYVTVSNSEGIFRIKFEENKSGHYHTHIYYHDGSGSVDETTDEVSGSPFQLGLSISSAYPAFRFPISETTNRTVSSDFVRVTYPDFKVVYDLDDDAVIGEGEELLEKAWDTSGNENHGTVHEATWRRDGKYGKALEFDGDDYVDMGNALSSIGSFTIEAWIKPDDISGIKTIAGKLSYGALTGQVEWGLYIWNERIAVNIADGTVSKLSFAGQYLTVGIWQHVAVTWTQGGTVTLYLNGEGTSSSYAGGTLNDTEPLRIGASSPSLGNYFDGIIDEVRIYNRALSEPEIQTLYNGGEVTSGLVGEWLFDGGNNRGEVKCYSEDTEVLTRNGFKLFKDLTFEDEIATLNPKTGLIEYHEPSRIISYFYHGKMYRFGGKNSPIDLLVTPDHNMFVKEDRWSKYRFMDAEELAKKAPSKHYSIKRDARWKGKETEWFELPIPEIKKKRTFKPRIKKKVPIESFLRFLGWYLAEGCAIKRKDGAYEIYIRQKDPANVEEIINSVEGMGFHAWYDGKYVRIGSKQLFKYVKQFGKSYEKFVPGFIKELSPHLIKIFFEALMKGDGHYQNGKLRSFTTTSPKLRDDVQELALKLGIPVVIRERSGEYNKSMAKGKWSQFNYRTSWQLSFATKQPNARATKVEEVEYSGMVYDVTVPNHTLYVRRNGKAVWSGNCYDTNNSDNESEWIRVLDVNHQFEGDCVIENGLIRLWINEGAHQGLKFYWWNGSSWTLQVSDIGIKRTNDCDYPFLKSINFISTESACLNIRLEDSATQDNDYFVDIQITLKRGSYAFEVDFQQAYPNGSIEPDIRGFGGGFVYVQDDLIGGGKLSLTANNPTMTDNFIAQFLETGNAILFVVAVNKKPAASNQWFRSWTGTTIELENIDSNDIEATKMYLGLIPFAYVSNLFKEAENATLGGGATVDSSQGDDSGDSVLLDAQGNFLTGTGDYVHYQLADVLNKLPKGRYLLFVRAKDSAQITDDLRFYVRNTTDNRYLNEENDKVTRTLTGSFAYYGIPPIAFGSTTSSSFQFQTADHGHRIWHTERYERLLKHQKFILDKINELNIS